MHIHSPNFDETICTTSHKCVANAGDTFQWTEFAELDSRTFVNFELTKTSVAILLRKSFDNIFVVDTPYKHFAGIATSNDQAIVI